MLDWVRRRALRGYERLLERELDGAPTHVAIIQDGNRRYARKQGNDAPKGHRAGADTTEQVLDWCDELGVEELTLYAFSTENFNRDPEEREALFDLLEEKLYEFADADRVHDSEVCIHAIGAIDRLPKRVQEAVEYAERRTRGYDRFRLNIALAYGGRTELLGAARDVARAVGAGDIDPSAVDVATIENRLAVVLEGGLPPGHPDLRVAGGLLAANTGEPRGCARPRGRERRARRGTRGRRQAP